MDATHRESVHALASQINHIATPVQDAGSQLSWWDGRAAALYAGSNLNETLADSPDALALCRALFPPPSTPSVVPVEDEDNPVLYNWLVQRTTTETAVANHTSFSNSSGSSLQN